MIMINKKGQSLVELIVAIAVIEIGLFSVWSLFLVNFNAEREAEYRIVGINLSREGIEVVKNIRDSNWLKRNYNKTDTEDEIISWDQYLTAGTYSVNYDSQELISLDDEDVGKLYTNKDGFFTNLATAETDKRTPYSRKVIIKDICCLDENKDLKCDDTDYQIIEDKESCGLKIGINVMAETNWEISGKARKAVVEDNLYDWQ